MKDLCPKQIEIQSRRNDRELDDLKQLLIRPITQDAYKQNSMLCIWIKPIKLVLLTQSKTETVFSLVACNN